MVKETDNRGNGIMNDFNSALNLVNKMIYEPNGLAVQSVQEEKKNAKYGAGTFQLFSKTVFKKLITQRSQLANMVIGKRCILFY